MGKGYFENEEYVRYYSYNGRNQLIGMTSDKTEAIYKYDPTGRRESKTVNGKTTTHRWDGSNIVSEAGENPTVYYMGINLIAQKDNAGISYYQYNAHGDITGLENTKTKMLTRYEYDAFGGSKDVTGTVYGYNGQYTDRETGLIYLRNRYYDPETGRFTQEDPVMDGLNWYTYCGNNPVNFVDPNGLDAIKLTNSNAVGIEGVYTAGYTSAIYQDDNGNWFYTYWGDKAAAIIRIPDEYMNSLEDFNAGLNQFLTDNGFSNITSNYDCAT